jgi:hypothetical protein
MKSMQAGTVRKAEKSRVPIISKWSRNLEWEGFAAW